MFDLIYSAFFFVLLAEGLIFMFLTLPTPRGWKGKVVSFLNTNQSVKSLKKIHLGFCILVFIFLLQSYGSQDKYRMEKNTAKKSDSIGAGIELHIQS